ncbi:MAG: hypothetical protein LBL91_02290, partial [Lachnospiraceae bacterium]|nr:hypothetical protein [Lachnospiraceae bacterium]
MKSSIKKLAMWLIVAVIFLITVYALVNKQDTKMTYDELRVKIESAEVKSIVLSSDGTKAYVVLKGSTTEKEVLIPSLDSFMNNIDSHLKT